LVYTRDFLIRGFIPLRGSPLASWVELGLHPPMLIIVSESYRFHPIPHCKSLLRDNLFFSNLCRKRWSFLPQSRFNPSRPDAKAKILTSVMVIKNINIFTLNYCC
jgi:hypothetical protein